MSIGCESNLLGPDECSNCSLELEAPEIENIKITDESPLIKETNKKFN